MDRAPLFGMHTFAAFRAPDDRTVWRCLGCHVVIESWVIEQSMWDVEAGASCPQFLMSLPAHGEGDLYAEHDPTSL